MRPWISNEGEASVRLPAVQGDIERRLLVNYRVDPALIARTLPRPFRPTLVDGSAVAGICLIRLGHLRPRGLPGWVGLRSENAAHRVAVDWDDDSGTRSGVYIPRRDSDSLVNAVVEGRLYPGHHHRAHFQVTESESDLRVSYASEDSLTAVSVHVRVVEELTGSSLFRDVASASAFFERGAVGFSATRDPSRLDGLELQTAAWRVEPGHVVSARSSFFDNVSVFPPGTAELDCALVMRRVPVTWKALPQLHPGEGAREVHQSV